MLTIKNFLLWLEGTSASAWVRESPTVFAFPAILSAHTISMGLVAGINVAIALRILGVGRDVPVVEMRRFLPVMWGGFWLSVASGIGLLLGYPTKALTNPMFYLKLGLVAIAMLMLVPLNRRVFNAPESEPSRESARPFAIVSIAAWAAVITTGRLLAYTYRHLTADLWHP